VIRSSFQFSSDSSLTLCLGQGPHVRTPTPIRMRHSNNTTDSATGGCGESRGLWGTPSDGRKMWRNVTLLLLQFGWCRFQRAGPAAAVAVLI
jgi:hypothetical protein